MAYRLITPPARRPEHIRPRALQKPPEIPAKTPKPQKTEPKPPPPKPKAKKPKKTRKARKYKGLVWSLLVILLVGVLVVGAMSYLQSPAKLVATIQRLKLTPAGDSNVSLPWPKYGQSALGAQGYGVLATSGTQTQKPTASIAKVITALAVLSKKPLKAGQQGPTITLTQRDVDIYDNYFNQNGSIVPVKSGESITQYQILEAMMLPSADNLADTLAIWAFGSVENYVTYANSYVKKLGLKHTTIADASGLSPSTMSTPSDLVLLGIQALKNPTMTAVVNEQLADIPVAGTVFNRNYLLGTDGVVGIKTGNTNEAGGCLLFAANRNIKGQVLTVVGVVMGAPDYNAAIKDSQPLITASDNGFELRKVVVAGSVVGNYSSAWGAKAKVIVPKDLSVLVWKGATPDERTNLYSISAPAHKGQNVGTVSVESGGRTSSVPAILTNDVKMPPASWRIFH